MAENIVEIMAGAWGPDVKNAAGIVVVYFWAPWCGHCKHFAPVFEKVASDLKDKARFAKVNCDDQADIVSECAIRGTPTIIIYRDGAEINRRTGEETELSLLTRVEGYLAG